MLVITSTLQHSLGQSTYETPDLLQEHHQPARPDNLWRGAPSSKPSQLSPLPMHQQHGWERLRTGVLPANPSCSFQGVRKVISPPAPLRSSTSGGTAAAVGTHTCKPPPRWAAHPSAATGFGCQGDSPGMPYLPGPPGSASPSHHRALKEKGKAFRPCLSVGMLPASSGYGQQGPQSSISPAIRTPKGRGLPYPAQTRSHMFILLLQTAAIAAPKARFTAHFQGPAPLAEAKARWQVHRPGAQLWRQEMLWTSSLLHTPKEHSRT